MCTLYACNTINKPEHYEYNRYIYILYFRDAHISLYYVNNYSHVELLGVFPKT